MKPVEIEFLMRDHLSGGLDNARVKAGLLDASLKRAAITIGAVFSAGKAIEFGKLMMDVRGQIDSFQISFSTLIGDKGKAEAFFSELKDFAVETPLMLDDLAKGAQMMLGFGVDLERVMPVLKQIGDVTMGDPERFNSMVLAFSQMFAAGKLMGQDLLQMINAGFNPLMTISERTGRSVAQLKDDMSEGAISAEMVAQAFADATSEGGKFNGMLEKQSEGVRGMKSNYEGAVEDMLNDLGTKSQDLYIGGLKIATALVKNYNQVGKVLVTCTSVYGSYKAAVMAVHLAEKLRYQSTLIQMAGMTKMQAITDILRAKTAALNKTMLANPYVLVAMAVGTLITATVAYSKSCSALADEVERVNKREKEQADLLEERKSRIEELINTIQDENVTNEEKHEKLESLKSLMPSVFKQYETEKELIDGLTGARQAYNAELREEKSLRVTKNLEDDRQRLADLKDYLRLRQEFTRSGKSGMAPEDHDRYTTLDKRYKGEVQASRGTFQPFNHALKEMIKAMPATIDKDIEALRADTRNKWETAVQGMNADAARVMAKGYEDLLRASRGNGNEQVLLQGEIVPVSLEELEERLQLLNNRAKTVQENAVKDFLEDARVTWDAAKQAVKDIIVGRNDRDLYPDESAYESALSKARQAEASAKKRYEGMGGETSQGKINEVKRATEESNRLKVERDKRARQIEEHERELAARERASELEIREAKVNAMEEGFEKERAVISLQYDKMIEENRQRREQWVKELQGKTDLEFENLYPGSKKKGLVSPVVTSDDLSNGQKKLLQEHEDAAVAYKKNAEEKLLNDLLEKYRDHERQRVEINKKFDEERRAIETGDMDEGTRESSLAELERQRGEAIKRVNESEIEEMQKNSNFLVALFEEASSKSITEINRITRSTRELLSYLSSTSAKDITPRFGFSAEQLKTLKSSPKDLKAIKEAVDELYSIGVQKNPFASLIAGLKTIGKEGDTGEDLKRIGESAAVSADMVGGLAGNLAGMFEEMGNAEAADAMSGVQDVMGAISNIGQGFAKGGLIGGIAAAVGEAANFLGKAFAAESRHQEALKAIMNERIAQQREYNLLLLQQNLEYEKAETILGTDQYIKAVNAVQVMKDAYRQLQDEIAGTMEQQERFAYKNFGNDYFNRLFNKDYSVEKDTYSGLADIEIKTGHKKTGLFGWGKGKDIYSSILDVYPELLDANGEFNSSLAETIVNTREMSEEDKAALQNMIDLSRQAEEAWQEVRDYFSGIFGDLGNTLSDALVDAFRNGTDAAEGFTSAVTGMLEDLAEQMIYTVTLAPYIEKAQNDMLEIMKNEDLTDAQKFNNYTRILDNMTSGILGQQDTYNSLLEQYRDMAAGKGLNLWEKEGETQSGKTGTTVTASQESVTRLEGLYTSLLEYEINIDGNVESMAEGLSTAVGHLRKIEEHAGNSERHLEKIERSIGEMRDDISRIKRDGIKTS